MDAYGERHFWSYHVNEKYDSIIEEEIKRLVWRKKIREWCGADNLYKSYIYKIAIALKSYKTFNVSVSQVDDYGYRKR